MSVYQFAIKNTKQFIQSADNRSQLVPLTAFEAANVLAIAFMKKQEEVLADLVS